MLNSSWDFSQWHNIWNLTKNSLIESPCCTPCLNSQYYHHNFFYFRKLNRKKWQTRPDKAITNPQSQAHWQRGGPWRGFHLHSTGFEPRTFLSSQNLTFSLAHQLSHHRWQLTTPCTCTIPPPPTKVFIHSHSLAKFCPRPWYFWRYKDYIKKPYYYSNVIGIIIWIWWSLISMKFYWSGGF